MSKKHVEKRIKSNADCLGTVNEQIQIAHAMWEREIGPNSDGIRQNNISEELDIGLGANTGATLQHLVNIGIVEEALPTGSKRLVFASWLGRGGSFVNEDVDTTISEAVENLINHIHENDKTSTDGTGTTNRTNTIIRDLIANQFNLDSDSVEKFLRDTDDQIGVLNDTVELIREHDDIQVHDGYGEIYFLQQPYKYRLTEKSIYLYDK